MEKSSKSTLVGVSIAMLIVGGLIGFGITKAADNNNNKTSSSSMQESMAPTAATDGVTVGGAKMVDSKNIVANALDAKNVTTLVQLVKDANLVTTLESAGPFTVFAPNNAAIAKLPAATVTSLQQKANIAQLQKILTYHVVSGTYTSAALKVMAEKGQTLTSVEGEQITPVLQNGQLELKDAQGNLVTIQTSDVISSNGVTFVINSVLMP